MLLSEGITSLTKIFKNYPIQEVHQRSQETLVAMFENKENLHLMFKWFLVKYYQIVKKDSITGDFIIPLHSCNAFTFDAGIFSPYDVNYSYATMHNHDDVQLSTINIFGSGYNSLIFKQGFTKLEENEVEIELDVHKAHTLGNIEFIDSDTAHTVFFPKDLTITLTLWSSSRSIGNGLSDIWYRFDKKRRRRQRNKYLYRKYGVKGLSYVLQDWFYPENGKIYTSPYYQQVKSGQNFLNNFLFKLQQIGFDDSKFLEEYFGGISLQEKEQEILHRYLSGEKLVIEHAGDQMITPRRNVKLDEYRACFPNFDFTIQ